MQNWKTQTHLPGVYSALLIAMTLLASPLALAVPYGSPDARSIAMGGVGVASADNAYAGFFNPALLASYPQRKHRGGNQRIVFPAVHGQLSDGINQLIDFENEDYEAQVTSAVDIYNTTQSTAELLAVLNPVDSDLQEIGNSPLAADVYTGLVVTIPDSAEGGAFSLGRRLVMDGLVEYESADVALIEDYIEELDAVAAGTLPATLHPELYIGGALIDPTTNLVSRVDAAGLVIDDLAISMAWEIAPFETPVMIGFTPRFRKVTTYEFSATATSPNATQRGEMDNGESINLDLGYAQRLSPDLLVGVAVKNLIAEEFETESGNTLSLKPQIRVGSEYRSAWGTFSLDLDLIENKPLSRGDPSQLLAFGGEWGWGRTRVRAGIHTNLAASGNNSGFGYGAGVRLRLLGMFFDLSAATGASQQLASFQFGVRF